MANYSDLRKLVFPYVSGCPEMVIVQAISVAAREFFRQTQVWREPLTLDLTAGKKDYSYPDHSHGSEAYIEEIASVSRRRPEHSRDEMLRPVVDKYGLPNLGDRPIAYTSAAPEKLLFGPVPEEAETLDVEAVMAPTVAATSVPDAYVEPYSQALIHGAVFTLKSQSGHPWYDPKDAAYHQNEFKRHIADAIIRRNSGSVNAPLVVRPQPWI